MPYSEEQLADLKDEYFSTLKELQNLGLNCIRQADKITNIQAREHMHHGAGRRISVIRRAIQNIYLRFPPDTKQKIHIDDLLDVQINLQAFVVNLYGIFENFAWAFVLRHNLEVVIGDHKKISMFSKHTQKHLPTQINAYLTKNDTSIWIKKYLKYYRDSLAHRIPLYVPPFIATEAEGTRFNELEAEKFPCIQAENWQRLKEIDAEQGAIGSPCFAFVHAFSGSVSPKPILMHPQLLCDAKLVIEFGSLFLEHWHEHVQPDAANRLR